MQSVKEVKHKLNGKHVLLQFNDGSHSFVQVIARDDDSHAHDVCLQSVPFHYDVSKSSRHLFEIIQSEADLMSNTFSLISQYCTMSLLGIDPTTGRLKLAAAESSTKPKFRFQNPETTLSHLPVIFSGVGPDNEDVNIIADPSIRTDNPKYRSQLSLRLVDDTSRLPDSNPSEYLAYAVAQLPISQAPRKSSIGTFIPDFLSPILAVINVISMNPIIQANWTAILNRRKGLTDPWLVDSGPF